MIVCAFITLHECHCSSDLKESLESGDCRGEDLATRRRNEVDTYTELCLGNRTQPEAWNPLRRPSEAERSKSLKTCAKTERQKT